jgi:CheY-like chemotaxis protein
LPRVLERPAALDVPLAGSVRPVTSGVVLLVEDDVQVRRVAAIALERQGFEVLEADNGTVALELAAPPRRLSCVVTDVVMPIMGGVELVRRLRLLDPDVPVVVTSGYVDDANLFDDEDELGVRFVAKPFLPVDLVAAVCDSIGARAVAAETSAIRPAT